MHRLLVIGVVALACLVLSAPAAAWTWPADGAVLRPFGLGADPYAGGQHRGVDVAGPEGSEVRAPASGTVTFAGSLPTHGRGITIQTESGYSVTLVHLGTIGVEKGAAVTEGAAVGTMGWSGTPEHSVPTVHLGIRRASEAEGYVDPLGLLPPRSAPPPAPSEPTPSPAPSVAPAPAPVAPPTPVPVAPPAPPAAAAPPAPAAPPTPAPAGSPTPVAPPSPGPSPAIGSEGSQAVPAGDASGAAGTAIDLPHAASLPSTRSVDPGRLAPPPTGQVAPAAVTGPGDEPRTARAARVPAHGSEPADIGRFASPPDRTGAGSVGGAGPPLRAVAPGRAVGVESVHTDGVDASERPTPEPDVRSVGPPGSDVADSRAELPGPAERARAAPALGGPVGRGTVPFGPVLAAFALGCVAAAAVVGRRAGRLVRGGAVLRRDRVSSPTARRWGRASRTAPATSAPS